MSSNTVLNSGPAVGAAQSVIWSYSSVFLPPMSTAVRASAFSFVRALNALFIFHRHRVCLVDHVDLICSLYKLVGRFRVFFLSYSAPGFQLWFYFHLCICVIHWGLLLRLPWRTWVCRYEGQVWRWCSCFGSQGFWQHQVLRGVGS